MISVIIPVYNTEKYLSSCLDSILASVYKDFEIILINDGSTDRSLQICKEYSRENQCINLFEQDHQGVSVARNRGLKECRGEWIVFVDSDDIVSCDILSMIGQKKYQKQDLLIFDYDKLIRTTWKKRRRGFKEAQVRYFGEKDRILLVDRLLNAEQIAENGKVSLMSPCAKAYKREVIDRHSIQFSEEIMIGEDRLFNIEYMMWIQSCVYIPKVAYYVRIRPNSTMRKFQRRYLQNDLRYQRKLRVLLKEYGIFSEVEDAYFNSVLSNMADVLVRGIFHPASRRTRSENYELCCKMQQCKIYKKALQYSRKLGIVPRRVLLTFFEMEWYGIVEGICRLSYRLLAYVGKL